MIPRLKNIEVLNNYQLSLSFDNGVKGSIDLSGIKREGVFSIWNDYNVFKNVKIGEFGEPVWNNELDLDTLNLYLMVTGLSFEEFQKTEGNKKVA